MHIALPLFSKGVSEVSIYPGLLTLGSSYSLRLPIPADSGSADFVPDHSCGPVAAYTALPLGYMGYRFIGLENLLL